MERPSSLAFFTERQVETEDIAKFLKKEGCDEIQGFLYYRPMCEEDFEKLLLAPGV